MSAEATVGSAGRRTIAERVDDVCPYLLSEDGASRRLGPWRGHRCTALEPPARLALDKQRRLCLIADHVTCATYLAARSGARHDVLAPAGPDLERVTRWSITRTTPAVIEPGSRIDGLANRLSGTAAQAILGGALLVALLVMARGQFIPAGAATSSPSAGTSPSAAASASPSPAVTPTPAASVVPETPPPTPLVTPLPTLAPTPPAALLTYTVKSGDTLWDLAVRYHTTIKAIQELNNLAPNATLHVGQKLKIP
jgi:LysM repeat protein